MVAKLGGVLAKPSYRSLEEPQLKAALYFLTKGVVRVLDLKMFCKIMARLVQQALCFRWNSSVRSRCCSVHSSSRGSTSPSWYSHWFHGGVSLPQQFRAPAASAHAPVKVCAQRAAWCRYRPRLSKTVNIYVFFKTLFFPFFVVY